MPLNLKQVQFIQRRVVRLGSVEAVQRVYTRDDLVSRYAVAYARETFEGEEGLIEVEDGKVSD